MCESLKDPHRMFIQALMWKKICSSEEVRAIYRKCYESSNENPADLKIFVERINAAIRHINMSIEKGKDERTGKTYYVLTNIIDSPISRLLPEYKHNEIELFKKIINCIVESEDGKVSSTAILNLSVGVNTSKREIEEITKKFCTDGWLNEDKGYIYFSTRAIVELQRFFTENFKDIISICMCKEVVFEGVVCPSCDKKIHSYCKENYVSQMKRNCCPMCKEPWD